jgi:hypothetical protein
MLIFGEFLMQNKNERLVHITDTTANPGALGLLAFGMTTIFLNLHNAGFFALGTMILSMGIFYGGIAQVIAGIMEWKKNNTFGMTAFISYGFFWLSLVSLLLMPSLGLGTAPETSAMVAYFVVWGMFTFVFFIASWKHNLALKTIFGTLTLLFALLAIGDVTGSAVIKTIAGYEGIVCGLIAMYTGLAQVVNDSYGRIVLPIDYVTVKKEKSQKLSKASGEVLVEG